jgi:hypothetical protein
VLLAPVFLAGAAAVLEHADRLVGLEEGLIIGEHALDGGLGARGERLWPYPGWRQADMVGAVPAIKPGQASVDPPEAQVGAEKGKSDRGLAQQGRQQRGVGNVHA